MRDEAPRYGLFERFGIEIEFMIVDRATLAVRPIADRLIHAASGGVANEIARGSLAWSNELALHLIEIKTNGPTASFDGLAGSFLESLGQANALLKPLGARLLGGGMHPVMDPAAETVLWPHGYADIYRTFDRLFSCGRHGWANVQSTHINLPFENDEEFGRLHAAIRLVLPIIPALAASSPLADGRVSGFLDTRMEVYRANSSRLPSITAEVIPEPVFTMEEYQRTILEPISRDLAPLDPEQTLCAEWVNARGAIARFERNTIEIRVLDAQETPAADLAVAAAVIGVAKLFAEERFAPRREQQSWPVAPLRKILLDTVKSGEEAVISDAMYLRALGVASDTCSGREVWRHLLGTLVKHDDAWIAPHLPVLERILASGTLSSRILRALDGDLSRENIERVYRRLSDCLHDGVLL